MLKNLSVALCLLTSISVSKGDTLKYWVAVEQGSAFYYDVGTMAWVPIVHKEELSRKVFILIKDNSSVKIYTETSSIPVPNNAYFFLEDIGIKSKNDVVGGMIQIEAEYLPVEKGNNAKEGAPAIGLTYGQKPQTGVEHSSIPFYAERVNAIEWFMKAKRYDAAILSLKRMMMKYPMLYNDPAMLETLFSLYDKHELYGLLFDETTRLNTVALPARNNELVQKWYGVSKAKLEAGAKAPAHMN